MGRRGDGGGQDEVTKTEVGLQAVLLADSYEQGFQPMSLEMPKVLMPLANVPLIEYSLEFLAESGVKEVFVVCGWLGDKVQAYIEQSRWKDSEEPVVHIIQSSSATNTCEAIRELDGRDVLRSDPFVLLSGDVVSNVSLKPIIDAHKARRKNKDAGGTNNVMTMVFCPTNQTQNRLRPIDEDVAVVLNSKTKQILKYESSVVANTVHLSNGEVFDEHPEVEYRYNLLDCNIDICSQEMVNQIAENYDYKDLRRDYVRNEVQNRELNYRIHAHEVVLPNNYACRVRCPRTYDAISRDVVRRWLYPLVPDANWSSEAMFYKSERGFRYKDNNVKVARSSVIGEDTLLGAGTVVAEDAKVSQSILGEGCKIGKGAVVEGSYLWPGCIVEAGATVTGVVMCHGSKVCENAVVPRGCVLSFNVIVGAGIALKPFTRISTCTEEDVKVDEDSDFGDLSESEDENSSKPSYIRGSSIELRHDSTLVGPDGLGTLWIPGSRGPDAPSWAHAALEAVGLSKEDFRQFAGGIGCKELEESRRHLWDDIGDLLLDAEDEAELEQEIAIGEQTEEEQVLQFVNDLISSAGENPDHDSIVLELNSLKMVHNRTFEDLLLSAVPAVLATAVVECINKDQAKAWMTAALDKWEPTLTKLCVGVVQETALITAVELVCLVGPDEAGMSGLRLVTPEGESGPQFTIDETMEYARGAFPFLLMHLLSNKFVTAEAIQRWSSREGAGLQSLPTTIVEQKVTKMLIDQLAEMSSEEESDSEEESGSEEDDEEDE
mmetsp:Transcript_17443/g.32016  ORF Transcript_17443/g.32016 Transcript_17443/m.32016 type:complete len:774 (+) Transcript_17443:134-2455(+)